MAIVVKDRVKVTFTTTGTADFTLGSATLGFQSFAIIGDGNETYYAAVDAVTGDWEVGIGTYTTAGPTLTRTTVLESSAGGAKVSFGAGSKDVFCTYPAERSVYLDTAGSYPVQNTFNTLNATTATLTGGTVATTPSAGTDLVNKTYVDTVAAQGIVYHDPVYVESPSTVGNLNALYNQPGGPGVGVGATLTNNGTKAALVIDGVLMTTTKRVLIYNQTNAFENGVYTVTTVGTPDPGGTNWVLTRATDADTYAVNSPSSLGQGDAFYVQAGNTGAGELYSCNTVGVITFGTTNITFAQISATVPYFAGTGLNLNPSTTFNISNVGTAGTYGSPSNVPVFVTNAQGQVTSVTNTGIAITSAAVSGLAASATTDTTNAANITSGTLPSGRISGSYTGLTGTGALAAGSLASGFTTVSAPLGGTGQTSYAVGDLIYADTTTSFAKLADVAVGNALISGGVGAAPSYGKIGLATHVSGTLPVASGGTGVTSSTGTGSVVLSSSPTLVTPALGTPSALVGTNITGTAAGLSIGGNAATATTATNQSGGTVSATSITDSGNLTFTGTGNRITGDFSNATAASRVAFQTSTVNGNTNINVLPNGTGFASTFQVVNASDPTNASYISLNCNASESRIFADRNGTGTYLPMTFYTNGSERVRVDTSGNVGIGLVPSLTGGQLQVSGATNSASARFGGNANGMAVLNQNGLTVYTNLSAGSTDTTLVAGNTASTYMAFGVHNGTAYNERMRIDSSGNVGIGTAVPTAKLNIVDELNAGFAYIQYSNSDGTNYRNSRARGTVAAPLAVLANDRLGAFINAGYGATAGFSGFNGGFNIYAAENFSGSACGTYVTLSTTALGANTGGGGTERVRVDASGNVGIGTSSPTNKLDVTGTIGAVNVSSSTGTNHVKVQVNNTGGSFQFAIENSAGSNFGAPAYSRVLWNDGAYPTVFYTSSAERMRINSSGNVGIGTNNPGAPLEIAHNGASSYGTVLQVSTVAGTDNPVISLQNYNGGSPVRYGISCKDDGSLAFSSGAYIGGFGTERMSLTSSGTLTATSFSGAGTGLTGTAASLSIGGNATNLSTNNTNWSTQGTISAVVGQLAWKNYGNNHTIFDASQGTAPSGAAVNNTNSAAPWTASYPTLMGWNGSQTYGVRVDIARVSESCSGNATTATTATYLSATQQINKIQTVGSTSTDVNTNNGGSFEVMSTGAGTVASVSFHRPGAFAINMGLGTDNVFRIGGWSASADAFKLTGGGALTVLSTVTASGFNGNATTATALSTASGSAPSYASRAWVNFNGTGTVAIRASGNVSSITDNGTGDYTVNFTTAMPDADYAPVGSCIVSLSQTFLIGFIPATFSTGSFRFNCEQEGVNRADTAYNLISFFR